MIANPPLPRAVRNLGNQALVRNVFPFFIGYGRNADSSTYYQFISFQILTSENINPFLYWLEFPTS